MPIGFKFSIILLYEKEMNQRAHHLQLSTWCHIDLLKYLPGRDRVCGAKRCRELCSHISRLKSTIRVSEAMFSAKETMI